ncbi:MAG: IPT/TIG domain-containing protein [Candidatus Marinimicrobia bacterium]|nr:IPT/TIG domain-containing protein [Candidatus Neomarinimicrobiota bacterium]
MKINRIILSSISAICLIGMMGCIDNDYPDKIWDPSDEGDVQPVITAIDPPDGSFDGIGIVTITGNNFGANLSHIQVTFNGKVARIDTNLSTEGSLVVGVPVVITDSDINEVDSVQVMVSVQGAFLGGVYSGVFKLERAAITWGEYGTGDPHTVACDADENTYIATNEKLIFKIDPDGNKTDYASGLPSVTTGMKFGPGGYLYYSRNYKKIYRIPPGGGAKETYMAFSGKVYDIDFDQNGNLFAAGKGDSIFCVTDSIDRGVVGYVDYEFTALKVYNDYVYVAGEYVGLDAQVPVWGIWRNPITNASGDLGASELVFDWAAYVGEDGPGIESMVISASGQLYVGAKELYGDNGYEAGNAITIVDPASGSAEPFYTAVLSVPATYLCWGNSKYIYCSRYLDNPDAEGAPESGIFRIAQPEFGASYFGREL